MLWKEYEHGIGNSKPARDFTSKERGALKWKYAFRNNLWNLVDRLVRQGNTSDVAIDRVYDTYGRSKSPTEILRAIRTGKARGGHPNLQ